MDRLQEDETPRWFCRVAQRERTLEPSLRPSGANYLPAEAGIQSTLGAGGEKKSRCSSQEQDQGAAEYSGKAIDYFP